MGPVWQASFLSLPLRFWPTIDNHLRRAACERSVRVRLLVGCWTHSKRTMFPFLRSLAALRDQHTHFSVEVVRLWWTYAKSLSEGSWPA